MNTQIITYSELQNGDKIYNQGYLFIVTDFGNINGVVRYKGICDTSSLGRDRNKHIVNTGFNGGVYGCNATEKATIVPRY